MGLDAYTVPPTCVLSSTILYYSLSLTPKIESIANPRGKDKEENQ